MRVTIKDIARITNLSVATVSLVLNNKEGRVSEETRKRVLQVADEMDYRPNQLARGLVTRHTNTVGLIIPDVTNAFFANFAKNIQVTCQEAGYNMFLCNTNNLPEKDIEYVNALLERQVDGILLSLAATSDQSSAAECCDLMKKMGKPLVLIDRMVDDAEVLSVLVDHEMGGFLATQHLIQLGHTRIGCITGPMTVRSSKQRLKGYQRALKESRIEFDLSLIQEFRFEMLSDFNIVKKLLNEKVSAIFAFNDLIAYGILQQAAQHGYSIPDDFSLVGFDDLPLSELMAVPLTTISQPIKAMSETAADTLIQMISKSNPELKNDGNIFFAPKLVERKSTSPLKANSANSH